MEIKFFTRLFIELRVTRCVGNEDFAELQRWVVVDRGISVLTVNTLLQHDYFPLEIFDSENPKRKSNKFVSVGICNFFLSR